MPNRGKLNYQLDLRLRESRKSLLFMPNGSKLNHQLDLRLRESRKNYTFYAEREQIEPSVRFAIRNGTFSLTSVNAF